MLSSKLLHGTKQASSRMTPGVTMSIRRLDPLEAKMAQKRAELEEKEHNTSAISPEKLDHSSTFEFKKNVMDSRLHGTDSEHGIHPANWQKRMLVLTRLYPSKDTIPFYVHNGTMNRMHDRMRALMVVSATTLFMAMLLSSPMRGLHHRGGNAPL